MSARPANSRRDMAVACEVAVAGVAVFADTVGLQVPGGSPVRPEHAFMEAGGCEFVMRYVWSAYGGRRHQSRSRFFHEFRVACRACGCHYLVIAADLVPLRHLKTIKLTVWLRGSSWSGTVGTRVTTIGLFGGVPGVRLPCPARQVRPHQDAEILILRHQVAVLQRQIRAPRLARALRACPAATVRIPRSRLAPWTVNPYRRAVRGRTRWQAGHPHAERGAS